MAAKDHRRVSQRLTMRFAANRFFAISIKPAVCNARVSSAQRLR